MLSRKFEQVYKKIISQQTAKYQITKNIEIDPEKGVVDDDNGRWHVENPKPGLKAAEWFQQEYGIKTSPNTYIPMQLYLLSFYNYGYNIKSDIKDFAYRAKTLIDEGAALCSEICTDGDSCEFEILITIQQLYKHFGYFNYYSHNLANKQIRCIGNAYYKSIDEALKGDKPITIREAIQEVLQQFKTLVNEEDYKEIVQQAESALKQLNI